MTEKNELRNIYKTRRNGMSRHDTAPLSARICAALIGSDLFLDAAYLYAYYPLGSEADVRLIAQTAWQEGKHVAFPKVCGEKMRYFEVTDFGQLAEGTFGVMEPVEEAGAVPVDWRVESAASPLLVLVPGIAFDMAGNRMGYGKGYYDRHFADCAGPQSTSDAAGRGKADSADTASRNGTDAAVILVGVAYASQVAERRLPAEAHDLVVSYLVTEEGIFRVGE